MNYFTLKSIDNPNCIFQELSQIGFDTSYQCCFVDKFLHKNIKIYNLTCAQANILKQTALMYGADCAVNKEVITGNIDYSDVILCGSVSQLKKIALKLQKQPFKLSKLSNEILSFMERPNRITKLVGILNVTPLTLF